jgi:hypothetical protein
MKHYSPIVVITLTLALSACSPEQLFSQLARTEVEEGAAEAIQRQQAQQQKLARIESKKSTFSVFVVLSSVEEDKPYQAIAYRNNFVTETKSIIDIEAIAPNPGDLAYLVWVRNPDAKTYLKIGSLEVVDTDDYAFNYETQTDLTQHSIIAISLDAPSVDSPENIILIGEFSPVER